MASTAKAATSVLVTAYMTAVGIAARSAARGWGFKLWPMVGGHLSLMVYLLVGYRRLIQAGYTLPATKEFYYKSIWNVFYLEYMLYPFI